MALRRLARDTLHGFDEHDLLTYASAIAFQVMTAIVPLLLFGLALLGFLDLGDAWSDHLAPQVRDHVSHEVYSLVDSFVRTALGSKQLFWLTAGLLLTIWEISGAVRASMDALSRIYHDDESRPRLRRYLISFALAVATIVLGVGAFVVVRFSTNVFHGTWIAVLRWPLGIAMLLSLVWLLLRFAPVRSHAAHWVSLGSALCVGAWLVTSVVYGLYVSYVADYGSIFASLAAVFLLLTYLYLSACAFLAGAQVDALIRRAATAGSAPSEVRRPSPAAAGTPPRAT